LLNEIVIKAKAYSFTRERSGSERSKDRNEATLYKDLIHFTVWACNKTN